MSRKASEIVAQVAKMTSSVAQVPNSTVMQPRREDVELAETPRRKSAKPRFTVIMSREQHRFIMQFALDLDSDASTITRNLFTILQNDATLAHRLRQELDEGGRAW
jgi:hypothetical protein